MKLLVVLLVCGLLFDGVAICEKDEDEIKKRFILDTLVDVVNTLGNAALGVLSGGANLLANTFNNVVGGIGQAAVGVLSGGIDLIGGAVSGIDQIINGILGKCYFFCPPKVTTPARPPVIQCPAAVNIVADPGMVTKVVRLASPTYHDPQGLPLRLSVFNVPTRNIFPEGVTMVRYTVESDKGLASSCQTRVTVVVHRCSKPLVANGYFTCSSSDPSGYLMLGDTCSFTCNSGYRRNGAATVQCRNQGVFIPSSPSCQAASCGAPPAVLNGQYVCPQGYEYRGICHLACSPGHAPAGSNSNIHCLDTGLWTNPSSCVQTCQSGQYSATGLTPCTLCPMGSYSNGAGSTQCTACPSGLSTISVGATSVASCYSSSIVSNQCDTNPCGSHPCFKTPSGYQCQCQNGYSGQHCQVPPNFCINNGCVNNGKCVTTSTGYTCSCPVPFTGRYCESIMVDGGWGPWSLWSECSESCGSGVQSRQRLCNNPPASNGGAPCSGNTKEIRVCNSVACPECLELKPARNTILNCTRRAFSKECTLTCQPGTSFPVNPLKVYECGISTSFQWYHQSDENPNGRLPGCSTVESPNSLSIRQTVTYLGLKCSSLGNFGTVKQQFSAQIEQSLSKLACKTSKICNAIVEVKCDTSVSDVTVVLTLTIPQPAAGDLDLAAFFDHRTVSTKLAEYLKSVVALETSGQQLMTSTNTLLTMKFQGTSYTASSNGIVTIIDCPAGSIPLKPACVRCAAGTKQVGNACNMCEVNTYQDREGQTTCIPCPLGKITVGKGATGLVDCTGSGSGAQATVSVQQGNIYIGPGRR